MGQPVKISASEFENLKFAQYGNSDSDSDSEIVNSDIVVISYAADCDCGQILTREGRKVVHFLHCRNAPQRKNSEFKAFDDISLEMARDGAFLKAFDAWGADPGTLYREVCRLGIERVREEIRQAAQAKGIRNRGAYLRTRLRNLD